MFFGLYQEYVGKIMSPTLKSWTMVNPPSSRPNSIGWGMSSACRSITTLHACCMVTLPMAKGTLVDLRSATRTASKPMCTGARSSQRNSRNMPETDHTGEPWSSRPLPDLKKRDVWVLLQLETSLTSFSRPWTLASYHLTGRMRT